MSNVLVLIVGILLVVVGISLICFITIPSIFGIGEGVEGIVDGDVGAGLSNMVVGGLILYLTTVLFIIITVMGVMGTFLGVIDN